MISLPHLAAFALVALGMVLTPGPNMIYLITRSILQGRKAGFISLIGVIAGFVFYMLSAAFGVTALLLTVPFAFRTVQLAGAAYLLWLAFQSVRPGARSVLQPRADLGIDGPARLFSMGFITNLLNPKIAVLYVSLLPQFIDPAAGHVLAQSLTLGITQILISFTVNSAIVMAAGFLAAWFARRPGWLRAQRYLMGVALAALAVSVAL